MTLEPDTQPRGGRPPLVLAIANQKGGVGKTTTAINLATALATADARTLLIDLDPQGNASTGLGLARSERSNGSYRLISGETDLEDVERPTLVENLTIVPADSDLAGAEIELVSETRREYRLRDALRGGYTLNRPPHDFVLVDCPPSLGLLTLNALVAADAVLVPLQCEFFALEGISQLMRTVELVRKKLNPTLRIQGIVLTMYDRRNNLSELVAADARSFFGNQVFDTIIPRSIRVSEAPSHGKPVLIYDPKSPGAQAYGRLALELVTRDRAEQDHAA
jgi:chromosome partitioning protein